MMRAGTKGRRQALIFMITNSGHDKTSVCYDYHEYGRKLPKARLRMTVSFLSFAPWTKEKTLSRMSPAGKSKPSLGHTFTDRYLREQVTQARGCRRRKALFGG
jgi:phage terminase large subunit-like protein